MIKYFKISEDLTEELEDELLEFLNRLEESDTCKIFFNSAGGDSSVADKFITIFNYDIRIKEIIFYWQCSSGGFKILCNVLSDKRTINKDIWSVVHRQSREVSTTDLLNKDEHTQFLINNMEKSNNKYREYLEKIGFNEEQLKLYDEGKDIYLEYEDIINLNIW